MSTRSNGRATISGRSCCTIVGSAGVGKSRVIGEFLARISGADQVRVGGVVSGFSGDLVKVEASGPDAPPLTVLRGRCLPYGTGITYWPLMELVQADLGITTADARDEVVCSARRPTGRAVA